jgi:CheY-like chemotaxis protein
VIEDNAPDVLWLRYVLDTAGIAFELEVIEDGEAAVEALTRQNGFAGRPDPDLVLMDLTLPRLAAAEVMEAVGGRVRFPLCIVSGSPVALPRLLGRFHKEIPCYLEKPLDIDKLREAFQSHESLRPWARQIKEVRQIKED